MQRGQHVRRQATAIGVAIAAALGGLWVPAGTIHGAATVPPVAVATPGLPDQPPVIVTPAEGAASAVEPVLGWTPVPGAGHYAVQIAADAGFTDPAYDVVTAATSATPEVDLAPGVWHWRVAVDEGGARGPWAAATFEKTASLVAPAPVAPADGSLVAHPAALTVSWTPVDRAASYEVELSRHADHSAPFLAATRTTAWTVDTLEIGETLHWRVRAVARDGVNPGPWSEWRSVGTTWANGVTGLQPADGAAVRDLVVSWDPVPGAAMYHVELTPVSGPYWGEPAVRSRWTYGTRLEADGPWDVFPEGSTWSWRVRAVTGSPADPLGPWSSPRLVTKAASPAPVLLLPADGSTTGQVVSLAWAPVARASEYEVQVSADASFAAGVATYATTETAYDLTTSRDTNPHVLVKGETYHWRVRGRNRFLNSVGLTDASPWSAVRTFTWDPPVATLVAPADGASVTVPTLSWDVGGTARFVRVTLEDRHGAVVERQVSYATTWTPTVALDAADGPFTWYVERVSIPGGDDATVAWRSAERSFHLAPAPAGGSSPVLIGIDGLHTVRSPLLRWSPVAGAASYRVFRGLDLPLPDPLPTAWSPELAYPAWTHPDLGADAWSYDVRVIAFDADDAVVAIGDEATFTIDLLPAPALVAPEDCDDPGCPVFADTPRLAWAPVPGATLYGVSVRSAWGLSGAAYVPEISWQPETDLGREFDGSGPVWSVRACVENRCGPAATGAFRVELPAPAQVAPADGAIVAGPQVTMTWLDLIDAPVPVGSIGPATTEASAYRSVLFGTLDPGAVGNVDVEGVASTSMLSPDTYTWELWAYTGAGIATRTATRSFTVAWAGPATTTPAAGAVVAHTPTLAWSAMSPATAYEVEVFRGTSTQPAARVLSVTTPDAATTPYEELDAGSYTWRVRTRVDAAASSWSPSSTFSIAGTAAPILVAPGSGEATATGLVEFSWQPVAGATAYRFVSDDDPSFGSPRESVVTGQSAWVPLDPYPSGTWFWQVQAVGPSNAVLAASTPRTLEVDLVDPVVSEPWEALARARTSAAGAAPVDVSWEGSDTQAGEIRFDVIRSVDGGPFEPYATGVRSPAVRPRLTSAHTYRFAVQAIDAAGHRSAWEYGRPFKVRVHGDGPSNVRYRGSWSVSRGKGYLGGVVHHATSPTASASFRFTGRQIAWVSAVGPTRGKARILIDGRYVTTVNLRAADGATRRVVFTRTWATSGTHTIRIEVVGTRGHPRVDVDGFVTLR